MTGSVPVPADFWPELGQIYLLSGINGWKNDLKLFAKSLHCMTNSNAMKLFFIGLVQDSWIWPSPFSFFVVVYLLFFLFNTVSTPMYIFLCVWWKWTRQMVLIQLPNENKTDEKVWRTGQCRSWLTPEGGSSKTIWMHSAVKIQRRRSFWGAINSVSYLCNLATAGYRPQFLNTVILISCNCFLNRRNLYLASW